VLSTLMKFVAVGDTGPTRRRVRRSGLTESEWRVAETFISARLLALPERPAAIQNPTGATQSQTGQHTRLNQ
jgi:hypothetical protein